MCVFDLPRSVRLATWASAVLRGSADPGTAVEMITGEDDPHEVVWEDSPLAGLPALWAALARRDVESAAVVLPVPGDALGLPGPATFNRAAIEAGEAVLVEGTDGAWGLVPQVETYGSAYEPGHRVAWHVSRVERPRITVVGSVGEAEVSLRSALRTATDELTRLDLSSWAADAGDRLERLRGVEPSGGALPGDLSPRSVRVLDLAVRVRAILELANEDDGGSVTLLEATTRRRTLLDLDRVCRHALVAAVNEPPRR
jgi:hypothetical protein